MAWLTDARIDQPRVLLNTTTEPIENIRPPHGPGRAGISSSGLPSAHRHLAEAIPGDLPPRRRWVMITAGELGLVAVARVVV